MAQSVAFAKTTRPAIGSIVPRARLFAHLDGAPGRTVAWISGPPGAGKTSLAASYVEARRWRVLWYQVDADDADVAAFFHYLGHAARKLEGERSLPKFAPQYSPDVALFARKFFRELFARAKGPMALVLDSLHAVPADSALHAALEAAFTQVPKNCCVVVTSRNEPPPGLARLRVTGELAMVSGESLRFEAAELAEMAKARGHELPAAAAAQLESRTQGWAAGIVLMLEHAKLSGRLAEFPDDAAPRAIFDYLAGEIFARFERPTQEFLLRIACLPRMTAGVAEALSGEPKAGRLLLNLALNDYFVSEVAAEEGRVFQLHPLLRDFLRSRAAQDLPEALAPLHLRRAAELTAAAGQVEDAVALLAECRDWPEIARLAAGAADAMLAQGRSETLAAWLELLPAETLGADPRLLQALAACRAEQSPRAARRLYEQAFEAFRRSGDNAGMTQCCAGLVDATILEFDDLATLDDWIPVLAGLLEERLATQAACGAELATLIRALVLRDPGARLDAWLERVTAAIRGSGEPAELKAELSLARSLAALVRGDFASAGPALEELAARAAEYASTLPAAIGIGAALQQLLVGSYDAAAAQARAALAATAAEGMHAYDAWLSALCTAALLGAGQRDAARAELQALEGNAAALRRGDRAAAHYLRAWLAALDADAPLAQREARAAVAVAAESGVPWLECLARVALAEILCEAADWRACEAQLRGAEALAARLRSPLLQYAVHLVGAGAAHERKDEAAALVALGAAFALGREQGFQHVPAWRRSRVGDLCVLALRAGVEPQFARTLARAHALAPRTLPFRVKDWPWPFRIQTLGRFEVQRTGGPLEAAGKGPGRPVELLKVLIALGGQGLRADQLADALWPHAEADYAHKSFTATLHRLRRLLGMDEALVLRDARLSMSPSLLWVDAWALEQALAELDETLRAPAAEATRDALGRLMDEVFSLYRGPFLADESEQPAYIAFREQLRARLLRCLVRVARVWEDAGRHDAAADGYLRCIEADALFEAPYRNLMLLYQRAGDSAEARATYERLRAVLSTRMKTLPSPETQAVFAAIAMPGAASRA